MAGICAENEMLLFRVKYGTSFDGKGGVRLVVPAAELYSIADDAYAFEVRIRDNVKEAEDCLGKYPSLLMPERAKYLLGKGGIVEEYREGKEDIRKEEVRVIRALANLEKVASGGRKKPDALQKYLIEKMLGRNKDAIELLGLSTVEHVLRNGDLEEIELQADRIDRWRANDTYAKVYEERLPILFFISPFRSCNQILYDIEDDIRTVLETAEQYKEIEFLYRDFLLGNLVLRRLQRDEVKDWADFLRGKKSELAEQGLGEPWLVSLEFEPQKTVKKRGGKASWPREARNARIIFYDKDNNSATFDVPEELNGAVYTHWLAFQLSEEKVREEFDRRG